MLKITLPLKKRMTVAKFDFPLKRARHQSQFLNSFQKLVLNLSEIGDVRALEVLEKRITSPKSIKASKLTGDNKFIDKNLAKRFESTVLQQRAIPAHEIEKATSIVKNAKNAAIHAKSEHDRFAFSIAGKFGVDRKAVENLRIPPFYEVQTREIHGDGKQPLDTFHFFRGGKRIDFGLTRQIENKIVPTQHRMRKRLYDMGLNKEGSSGVAYAGISVVKTENGERILLVDNIQTYPRSKKYDEIILKESFPEYRDYQKLMLLDAFRAAEAMGVKRVFLPDSGNILFSDGSVTKNIKRARDDLGKSMSGKSSDLAVNVKGKKVKIRGFEWEKK